MQQFFYLCGVILLLSSCSQVTGLGPNQHDYLQSPDKIIWLQLPALSAEHLALLRFDRFEANKRTSFERASCIGQSWSYNLYRLRPKARSGLLSQLVGRRNMQESCHDYAYTPIWQYWQKSGFNSAIFEAATPRAEDSLLSSLKCSGARERDFLGQSIFWKMARPKSKKSQFFHAQEKQNFKKGSIYYDRSCSQSHCYSNLFTNVKSTFEAMEDESDSFIYLMRDFTYAYHLKNKDLASALDVLSEWEKIYDYFLNYAQKKGDVLVLITSAASVELDLPQEGQKWTAFRKKGAHILFGREKLISPVLAYGARAENFCGIYEESTLLEKMAGGEELFSAEAP